MTTTYPDGVVFGLPFEQYRAAEAMSASGAKKMLRSPAHYKLDREQPSESTAAMNFGSAVHLGVLEPDRFGRDVAIAPDVDRRTKLGKEAWQLFQSSQAGKIILSLDDHVRALCCMRAVQEHPAARDLLEGAHTEISMFWTDRQYKVPCKARYDARNHNCIIDLKTCEDASPDGFARAAARYQYHVQAAHYISAAEHLLDASPDAFIFICVESEPPHAVAVYTLPSEAILAGMHLMSRALERYRDALAAGTWPGYPATIERLPFPAWALKLFD